VIKNIQRSWFEVWGTEEAQNKLLKGLVAFLCALVLIQSIVLMILSLRKLPVIAVSSSESKILTITPPKEEILKEEIRRTITEYVINHYNWDWQKIDESFAKAARLVDPDFQKSFNEANLNQAKLAKEKKISQKFYLDELKFDPKASKAILRGNRIIQVEGLNAVSPLDLEIEFHLGNRSESNPEGIFIVGEKYLGGEK
jgi:hypothetical protein